MQIMQKWKATSSGRTYKAVRWGGKLNSGGFLLPEKFGQNFGFLLPIFFKQSIYFIEIILWFTVPVSKPDQFTALDPPGLFCLLLSHRLNCFCQYSTIYE